MVNYTEQISLLMADVVQRVPTLSFIDMSKVLVFARPGMIPGAALEDLVDKVKALDMADVHRKLAEQEAEHAKQEAAEAKGETSADDKARQSG